MPDNEEILGESEADPGFPIGGHGPITGGVDLQHGHFLVKMYVKTKELDPVGGHTPEIFVCRSANGDSYCSTSIVGVTLSNMWRPHLQSGSCMKHTIVEAISLYIVVAYTLHK